MKYIKLRLLPFFLFFLNISGNGQHGDHKQGEENEEFDTVAVQAIRMQAGGTDKQFLKGMIPHHAAANLMSKKAASQEPNIKKLQEEIISSQQREIEQMKAKLKELK